jgi:ABC-type molybdenum transport system ATPase subunit/photorepair protein PhrA
MILGRLRVIPPPPPPGGMLPFLSVPPGPPRDPHDAVTLVSFAQRPRSFGSAFYDYTARYGAVWDEDRITLRQSMFPELISESFHEELSSVGDNVQVDQAKKELFEGLVDKLALKPFLDLPMVALSNGQTRRARIVKALLSKPDLLLLDEPFSKSILLGLK